MKPTLLILLSFIISVIFSQTQYINQVLLLNEGSLNFSTQEIIDPVKIGSYDPQTNTYTTIIEISGAKFATDLIIHENSFFVAADDKIFKYDLNTYEMIVSVDVPGVRKLCIYNDYLFITKGDYDNATYSSVVFDSYLEVYSMLDLSLIYSFISDEGSGPQWSTESIISDSERIYVAINNGFEWGNYKGIIGIIDPNTFNYIEEVDLGEEGINPINMFKDGDKIYTLNNKNFDGSSLSILNTTDLDTEIFGLTTVNSGCGASIIRDEKLYYQDLSQNQVYKFDIAQLEESGLVENLDNNYYTMSLNPVNGYLYASITDYTSDNQIMIYDQNNEFVNSFIADVATNKIIFDVRSESVAIQEDLNNTTEHLIKSVDLLGRKTNPLGLNFSIFDNGFVSKKYILK